MILIEPQWWCTMKMMWLFSYYFVSHFNISIWLRFEHAKGEQIDVYLTFVQLSSKKSCWKMWLLTYAECQNLAVNYWYCFRKQSLPSPFSHSFMYMKPEHCCWIMKGLKHTHMSKIYPKTSSNFGSVLHVLHINKFECLLNLPWNFFTWLLF